MTTSEAPTTDREPLPLPWATVVDELLWRRCSARIDQPGVDRPRVRCELRRHGDAHAHAVDHGMAELRWTTPVHFTMTSSRPGPDAQRTTRWPRIAKGGADEVIGPPRTRHRRGEL